MSRIIFLLEERSMKVLLDGLLPRLVPGMSFLCIPHEGKQDLEKSIPRKLRAWREPGVQFVIVRDNDRGDCRTLKDRLSAVCAENGRADALVRIACQELEAWYFGESQALAEAFNRKQLIGIDQKARYRDPDAIKQPSRDIVKLIPEFQKVSGARHLASCLSRTGNRSRSFQVFIEGVERLFDKQRERGRE
ncbi:MAG: DUF4276 family protein [Verrucomicrobia bacterium]|nr:DUF4276 family protein [Verrucomicrobiota bacterium]